MYKKRNISDKRLWKTFCSKFDKYFWADERIPTRTTYHYIGATTQKNRFWIRKTLKKWEDLGRIKLVPKGKGIRILKLYWLTVGK